MPQFRDPLVWRVSKVIGSTAGNDLMTPDTGRPGQVMYIDNVSLMNETAAGQVVDIGFFDGRQITWTRTMVLTTAGYWYYCHVHWSLTTDYQIIARFRTSPSMAHMNVNGYVLEPYTSP